MSDSRETPVPWPKRIEAAILTVIGVAATLIMAINALSRYIFGKTFVWSEEIIRMLFVWGTFIAITTAFARNEHIGFDGIAKKNPTTAVIADLVYSLCLVAVGGILAWYGYRYMSLTGSVPLPATNLPTSLFMWPGICAGAVWCILGIVRIGRLATGRRGRRNP